MNRSNVEPAHQVCITRRGTLRTAAAMLLAPGLIGGCASINQIRTGADVVLLHAEFEDARAQLDAVPFSIEDHALVEAALDSLEAVRNELVAIARGEVGTSGANVVIAAVRGQPILDNIAAEYLFIKEIYLAHLERTGEQPSFLLKNYATSAENVYDQLTQVLGQRNGIELVTVTQYLGYLLRGYAVYKSGGLAPV